jgi:heterodisulfide reductase subunit B
MVLNSYILYNVNYKGPDKLKSRYSYSVSIIKSLGEEWLVLKDNAGADDPRRPQVLRKLPEEKESQIIVRSTKVRRGREPEQYVLDATKGCMENASLNTGANCKRYICTVFT